MDYRKKMQHLVGANMHAKLVKLFLIETKDKVNQCFHKDKESTTCGTTKLFSLTSRA